ncbi:hypothetical protein [Helicobacter pylori]|uniref:hypothetical protein n=1 Tax=Helicobacter pylori TaxID=210 RepID=UPI00165BE3D6|nr:hypothetical protein [Helicobacter pylori]
MTDREKFEAEKIKTEKESYFKINAMRYDFAKQRYIALMPILVAALGLIPFAIDKLNVVCILKTLSSEKLSFSIIIALLITASFFLFLDKQRHGVLMSILVVVFGLIPLVPIIALFFLFFDKQRSIAPLLILVVGMALGFILGGLLVAIISSFLLYIVFVYLALHTTYGCLLDLEKYFECQAETKDCEIRKLQSNTDRENIEKKRQECENNEKKAREYYEEEKGKLSYCLLIVMISVMFCVVFSVIYNINFLEHKTAKKMTSDQNSNMECFGLTIENPKPKDSKDNTKK